MSINSLLTDTGSKSWADLYVDTLKCYSGLTVCGPTRFEGPVDFEGGVSIEDLEAGPPNTFLHTNILNEIVWEPISPSGGPTGPTGPQGPAGVDGNDGATGPTGPQGLAGADGADGAIGATGPTGPQGLAGADGNDGTTGLTGPQGLAGADGADGAIGATGSAGPQGPAGADGNDGATGPTGPQGPAGADGADGAIGATGPTGPQGPAGAIGATGPTGPSIAQQGASVFLASSTSISNVSTKLICDSINSIAGGAVGFNDGSYNLSTGDWTCPASGLYQLNICISYNKNFDPTAETDEIQVYRNGSIMIDTFEFFNPGIGSNDHFSFKVSALLVLSLNDVITVFWVVPALVGTQSFSINPSTFFSMVRIA